MTQIAFGIYIFLDLILILIFIDFILSIISIFGINLRPKFLNDIVEPLYRFIKKIIPTNIGTLDFSPFIVSFIILFFQGLILKVFPEVNGLIQLLSFLNY